MDEDKPQRRVACVLVFRLPVCLYKERYEDLRESLMTRWREFRDQVEQDYLMDGVEVLDAVG